MPTRRSPAPVRLLALRRVSWLAVLALTGCGGSIHQAHKHVHAAVTRTSATATAPSTTTQAKPAKPPRGSLPQTHQRPTANTPAFHSEMAALWSGVTRDSLKAALPAFFPARAYLQVKAIANARADFANRLVRGFRLDIAAAHALLGSGASAARLQTVSVPVAYAHWVPPGVCYNRVGYWEVPNARVVYSEHGQTRSFGIASMISWRGVWYVVHLGAVVRSSAGGVVDDPSPGTGISAPSSTC
jgi:hypothetical protein